ncbi:sigma-70 family RNA polymerase sigma factor [Patescibacteria group bacterium]|nr:sigma-70 family RNA polymerase sigma factor [Patescibacteria group bacterium]MBU4099089.1 sigma-70 family RNA polymerase sigma factor [Patescibacteria group bacterium]
MVRILDRILQGDGNAVVEFYKIYSPSLLRYLRKKLPRKEDAEEVLNDIFFAAIDELHLFREKSNINTWLFRIARNKIADFYRKRKIKSVLLSQVPLLEIIANEIAQPEFQFEINKIRERIEKAFNSISVQYQKILHLHYEDRMPVKELAMIFNLSFKATESMLFRARKSFRQAYERA